jgi:hypothetical protein
MANWSGSLADEIAAAPGPIEWKSADKEVMVMQVIRTTNLRRGDGSNAAPIRAITQFWSMDGDLLAEVDPLAGLRTE